MATAAVATEEENLIILDDVITEDSPERKPEEPIASEEIIDFWSDTSNDLQIDLWDNEDNKEELNLDNNMELDNNSLDLWNLWPDISSNFQESNIEPEKEEKIEVEENKEDLNIDNSLWFWDVSLESHEDTHTEVKEEPIVPTQDLSVWLSLDDTFSTHSTPDSSSTQNPSSDLNSILDETISKLKSRSEVIASDKSVEQDNIKDFKIQISDLEDNVNTSEWIVAGLNKEAAKIRSNIKSLERMKLKDEVVETQKETSVKVHNTKRVRK